jgi:hypothetical protein
MIPFNTSTQRVSNSSSVLDLEMSELLPVGKRLVTTVCVSRRIVSTISIRGHNVMCQSPV